MSLPVQEGTGLDLAKAALQQGRFHEAVEYATAQTSADSGNFGAWQILGAAQSSSGNHAAAVDAFSQAAQLQPLSAPAHFNLAKALIAVGDTNRAQAELQTCLSHDPAYQKAKAVLQQLNPGAVPPGGISEQPAALVSAWALPSTIGTAPGLGGEPTSPYRPGQMGSPVGSAPVGGPSAGQPSAFGQPASFGQYGPPPTQQGSYRSSATLIGQSSAAYGQTPVGLLPATQAWSIISLILGVLSLGLFSLATLGMMVVPSAGSPMLLMAVIIDALIGLMFIVGSSGTLARKGWGRSILMGAAAAAAVMLLVDLVMTQTGMGMPPTSTYASPQAAHFTAAYATGVKAGTLIFDPLKIVYCLCLFLHLKSNRVKESMTG
ncbi:MAG: tetratricopeptide repeat protein [Armatimonadota bacterium]|nr:tetratricopeptide repeat protein [Armatimonadota bacterium]